MKNSKSHSLVLYLPMVVWAIYIVLWIWLNVTHQSSDSASRNNYSDTYSLVALTGSISGIVAAKKWGLFSSRFGKALGYFTIGLFMQFLGQLIYGLYFRIGNVQLAYPSVGDIPFLLTGVFYTLAIYNLLRIIVYKGSIFKPKWVFFTSIILIAALAWSVYVSFLHLAIHDPRGTIYSLANAAYPIIQAFYFLLGLVAIMQAKRMAGGRMLAAVSVLLIALIMQYVADFSFLYQSYHDTWQPAASNDLAYVMAYGLMALAILLIDRGRRLSIQQTVKTAE